MPAPAPLRDLAECVWVRQGRGVARILPDGCMDLIEFDDGVVVAGPDTSPFSSDNTSRVATGIRFRPGALPRLLGVPACEFRGTRVPLASVRPDAAGAPLRAVAAHLLHTESTRTTAPWTIDQLAHVTARFAAGASVQSVADEIGCSTRNLQRHSDAVYGYGPALLRRILRFRRAVRLLRAGTSAADTAHAAGYADQPHLHREIRALAGQSVGQVASAAYRSTDVPSGSATVA